MAVYFWIAIGSAFGGIARFWCSGVIARMFGETFPWGTLIVNVSGLVRHRPHRRVAPRLLAVWAGQILGTSINALEWI